MLEFFQRLFDTGGFPARWYCGLWSNGLGWLHIASDVAIFGAYAAIPITLVYFVRNRRDIPFPPVFWLFAAFIFCCGTGHLIEASIFWKPWYRLAGAMKFMTATVSWLTVIAMVKIMPEALRLPGLSKANAALAAEVASRQLAEQALTGALREREVLLQEVHHRVKNNLQVISSLINMQALRLELGADRSALTECQTRVQAIALIHEQLYQSNDYARVPFAEYARILAGNIFSATETDLDAVHLDLAIDDVKLAVDRAIPCGLLLNELMTNALKHGFKPGQRGTVRVELTHENANQLRMAVKDDGVGLPEGFEIRQSTSLGMQLIATLAKQLGAQLNVRRENGTAFEVVFAAQ